MQSFYIEKTAHGTFTVDGMGWTPTKTFGEACHQILLYCERANVTNMIILYSMPC